MNDKISDDDEVNKMNVADSCILTVVTIVFLGMIFVTVKVYRIVKFGDKRLMLMLSFLDLTLLCKILHSASW